MHRLRLTITHALGTFSGTIHRTLPTAEEAQAAADVVQAEVGDYDFLVLLAYDGSEVLFPKAVLAQSIITFRVEEVE